MTKRPLAPRALSSAMLALCSVFAVWSWTLPTLPLFATVGIYVAIVVVAPVLTRLDAKQDSPKRKWLYTTETLVRLGTITALFLRPTDPNWFVLLMVFVVQFCYTHEPKERYTAVDYKDNHRQFRWGIETMAGVLGLCLWQSMHQSIGIVEPIPLLFLCVLCFLTCLAIVEPRTNRWYGFDQPLSKEQHQDIWPVLHAMPTRDMWGELYRYACRHGDVRDALNALALPLLLSFFKEGAPYQLRNEHEFMAAIKNTINAKEPRAVVFWEMYDEKTAATRVEDLVQNKEPQDITTMELPAL